MIFDAVKRLLGLNSHNNNSNSYPSHDNQPNLPPNIDVDERLTLYPPLRQQLPPDINQIESEFANISEFMEQQMQAMMGSFGFIFGSPFAGIGFGDGFHEEPNRPLPFSPDLWNLPGTADKNDIPSSIHPALEPRDEVLKPQFRSRSLQQGPAQDNVLDERLEKEGLGSVIDELKPSGVRNGDDNFPLNNIFSLFGNGLFGGVPSDFGSGNGSGSVLSSSSITIYSNVNGHKSVEKIIRHPDGKIERTVVSSD